MKLKGRHSKNVIDLRHLGKKRSQLDAVVLTRMIASPDATRTRTPAPLNVADSARLVAGRAAARKKKK